MTKTTKSILSELRFFLLIILLPLMPICGAYATNFEGNADGGGGGQGVLCRVADGCRPENGKEESFETLDLWEAKNLHDQVPTSFDGSVAEHVDHMLQKLAVSYPIRIYRPGRAGAGPESTHEIMLERMRATAGKFFSKDKKDEKDKNVHRKYDKRLWRTTDAKGFMGPENGKILQIVNYQPAGGGIWINQDLFEKLDEINQAALIVHEAYYEALRYLAHETTSVRVRRAVGYVFSGHSFGNEALVPGVSHTSATKTKTRTETRTETLEFIICRHPGGPATGIPSDGTTVLIPPSFKFAYFSLIGGSALIGASVLQPIMSGEEETLQRIVQADCKTNPIVEEALVVSWESIDGPVEYDRSIFLSASCRDGEKKIVLWNRSPGESQPKSLPLTCRPSKINFQITQ